MSTSNISKPPDPFTFFLDRTHGRKILPGFLRRVGFSVVTLHEWGFAQETQDEVWIEECGKQGWVILSGDKGLERNPINKAAIIAAACKVFIFTDSNSKAEEWSAAVIMGRGLIARIIEKNNGPFYVHIGKESNSHISAVRFVGLGRRKLTEEPKVDAAARIEVSEAQPKETPPTEPEPPKQESLFRKE